MTSPTSPLAGAPQRSAVGVPTWPATDGPRWPDSVPTLIDSERRVVLRAHRSSDLRRIVEMCADREWARWTTTPWPYGTADGQAFLSTFVPAQVDGGSAMLWAVEAITGAASGGTPQFCGTVEIRLTGRGRGEIAFGLHPEARGLGLMRRAGRLALDWAFDVIGLTAVEWRAAVGNWGSRHVSAALGFRFEGVRRSALDQRGQLMDCWAATALATDPRTSTAPPRLPLVRARGLVLRAFSEDDLDRIVEACADPLTQRWLTTLPHDYGRDSARAFLEDCREGIARHDYWTWCIAAAVDDQCVGAVTLLGLQDTSRAGEIGYWVHPEARGRGVAGTAARLVADLALGELPATASADAPTPAPLHSVMLRVAAENHSSQAVARRAGADLVGRLPEAELLRDGTWSDLLLFSRVRGRAQIH